MPTASISKKAFIPSSSKHPVRAALLGLAFLIGCSSGGSSTPPESDLGIPGDRDMAAQGTQDGGSGRDGGARDLATPADAGAALPCAPSSYTCGPGNAILICNSTGTAWLYSATCAVSCSMGLCTGGCTPATRRCNAKAVEECNTTGTAWTSVETCSTDCYGGACTLAGLDITADQRLDGEVVVSGDVIVRSGVTVTAPTGVLTIRAHSITIEAGATVRLEPNGNSPAGHGAIDTRYSDESGGGGGYGTPGAHGGSVSAANSGGPAFGSDTDMDVVPGAAGANSSDPLHGGGFGGLGGGVLRLFAATDIHHAGAISVVGAAGTGNTATMRGGGGGGSGGGVLLSALGTLTVTGTIDTSGGAGGHSYYSPAGGAGGTGRIKLLAGGTITTTSATLTGKLTQGLVPPVLITSTSHPDPSRIYNDDFASVELSWNSPVASRQGYYTKISMNDSDVPTPASSSFLMTEAQSFPASAVSAGDNYFHIVTVDSMFKPSSIENRFNIHINSTPPTLSSTSHPAANMWYPNKSVYLSWALPVPDSSAVGVYYVLDHYGDTVPTKADTFIPLPQKQVVLTIAGDGIWFMHTVAEDSRGYLTRAAGHFRVNVGADPGSGVALGQVTDSAAKPVDGATVTISRGLLTMATNATGNYNFPMVPAGTYELRVSKSGYMTATKTITVTSGGSTNTTVVLN